MWQCASMTRLGWFVTSLLLRRSAAAGRARSCSTRGGPARAGVHLEPLGAEWGDVLEQHHPLLALALGALQALAGDLLTALARDLAVAMGERRVAHGAHVLLVQRRVHHHARVDPRLRAPPRRHRLFEVRHHVGLGCRCARYTVPVLSWNALSRNAVSAASRTS